MTFTTQNKIISQFMPPFDLKILFYLAKVIGNPRLENFEPGIELFEPGQNGFEPSSFRAEPRLDSIPTFSSFLRTFLMAISQSCPGRLLFLLLFLLF